MPFVMDKRLPEDTLFWIIEEDFRFWPPYKDPDEADDYEVEYLQLLLERSSPPPTQAASPDEGTSLPPSQRGRRPKGQERLSTEYHTALPRGQSSEDRPNHGFTRDVCDMMRIATMCHRAGMGDLIWVTYCPSKAKPSRIGHGSACILVTKHGMQAVHKAATETGKLARGHIDLELQRWLRSSGEAKAARACYLYPPIGSYTEHASGCDPTNFGGDKTRPSGFESGENPCHGTREEGDPMSRTKYMIQWQFNWERKWTRFAQEHILHSEQFEWKSFEEPTAFDDPNLADESQEPTALDDEWQHWYDSNWGSSHWYGSNWGNKSGRRSDNPGWTLRQKRAWRSFQQRMSKRRWVTTEEEALCVSVVVSDSMRTCSCITWCCSSTTLSGRESSSAW